MRQILGNTISDSRSGRKTDSPPRFSHDVAFRNLRRLSMRPSITVWPPELFSDWG